MARYPSGPFKGQEIPWWPGEGSILDRPASQDAGCVQALLASCTQSGQVVLDPFCQDDGIVRQVVAAGRAIIAVHFDPLAELRLRLALNPPAVQLLDLLLTRLGDAPKMQTTLRQHLLGLYQTTCPACGQAVSADAFLWDREEGVPLRIKFRCPACAAEADESATEADQQQAQRVEPKGMHYWYLMDRLAPRNDLDRALLEQLLGLYTPRNLYALMQILFRLESLALDPILLDAARWLLLYALEGGISLYAPASQGAASRPRRLQPPRHFWEANIWLLLEEAAEALKQQLSQPPLEVAQEPQPLFASAADASPRAWVARQSLRGLAPLLPPQSIALAVAQPPQFDALYWPLAYLWSGWLYDRQVAEPLRVLARRKAAYWPWYFKALRVAMQALHPLLASTGCLVLMWESSDPGYCETLLLAALDAGFSLVGGAFVPADACQATAPFAGQKGSYRLEFRPSEPVAPPQMDGRQLTALLSQEVLGAAQEALAEQGEPLSANRLEVALWLRLAERGLLLQVLRSEQAGEAPWEFLQATIRRTLQGALGERLLWITEQAEQKEGLWWLKAPPSHLSAVDERLEEAVRDLLLAEPEITRDALWERLRALFPVFTSSEAEWVEICLAAYAVGAGSSARAAEREKRERADWLRALVELGSRMGCRVWLSPPYRARWLKREAWDDTLATDADLAEGTSRAYDLLWLKPEGSYTGFAFCDTSQFDAVLSRFSAPREGEERYLVLSQTKSALLQAKIRRSLLRRKRLQAGEWRFVKGGHLRKLSRAEQVDWHEWAKICGLEPPIEQGEAQLPLF